MESKAFCISISNCLLYPNLTLLYHANIFAALQSEPSLNPNWKFDIFGLKRFFIFT